MKTMMKSIYEQAGVRYWHNVQTKTLTISIDRYPDEDLNITYVSDCSDDMLDFIETCTLEELKDFVDDCLQEDTTSTLSQLAQKGII